MNKAIIEERAPKILSEIENANTILLHCHVNPDQDSYGSSLAMYHVLKGLGKDVTVIKGDGDLLSYLSPLPGYGEIVEKNFFEIDIPTFDLFIVLDSSRPNRISRLGDIVFPDTLTTICIDHHELEDTNHKINLTVPDAPSTTSILYHLFNEWKIKIGEDTATCILTGLYGDTNNFTNSAADFEAFFIASKLSQEHPESLKTVQSIQHNDEVETLVLTKIALGSLEILQNDKVAMVYVNNKTLQENKIRQEHIERATLADKLISVSDWDFAISILEIEPGLFRTSFRTHNPKKYNVAHLAQKLGGGGHAAAAGVMLKNTTFEEAKNIIFTELRSTFYEK